MRAGICTKLIRKKPILYIYIYKKPQRGSALLPLSPCLSTIVSQPHRGSALLSLSPTASHPHCHSASLPPSRHTGPGMSSDSLRSRTAFAEPVPPPLRGLWLALVWLVSVHASVVSGRMLSLEFRQNRMIYIEIR